MSKPGCYEELTRLVSALLDGQLSAEDSVRLESLLASDPAARSVYIQMIDQEIELSCLMGSAEVESQVSFLATLPMRKAEETSGERRRWPVFAAAAVVLLAGLVLAVWRGQKMATPSPASSTAGQFGLRDSWGEDFEGEAASPWFGRIVSDNLPPGSKRGIAPAVRTYPPDDRPHYVIQLAEDWRLGLFALTSNSTLHVTYYLGAPGSVNVFMHTLPAEGQSRGYDMFQLFSEQFPGRPSDWRTASIPFSRFVRKVPGAGGGMEFGGGPPESGERVTTLVFSSVEEIDFVLDRVWITPAGSGLEEVQALQNGNNK